MIKCKEKRKYCVRRLLFNLLQALLKLLLSLYIMFFINSVSTYLWIKIDVIKKKKNLKNQITRNRKRVKVRERE